MNSAPLALSASLRHNAFHLTPEKIVKICLKPMEQIRYKRVNVQPDKAVIVNTQKPNAPIEIGFAAP